MQQYFVGADGDQVVIFQGVQGSVLGIPLHEVAERPGFPLEDLPETRRSQVREGINANDGLQSARTLIDRLREDRMDPCAPPAQANPPAATGAPVTTAPVQPPASGVVPPPAAEQPTPLSPPSAVPGLTCRRVG